MKKSTLFIIFIFLQLYTFYAGLKAQTIDRENTQEVLDFAFFRVIYKAEQQALKEGNPFIIIDTMALDIGKTWSVYYDLFRQYKDSVDSYNFLNDSPRELLKFSPNKEELQRRLESSQEVYKMEDSRKNGESAKIYKNRIRENIMTIDEGPLESWDTYTLFRFTENIKPQEWVITEDTLTILHYLCQKATTSFRGRDYTVWFTMEIPVNEGPWKLYGLPGLILKVEESEGVFRMNAIGLEKIEKPIDVVWEAIYNQKGRDIRIIKKIIGGNLKQWKTFRREKFKKITISFLDPDAISSYWMKNPIVYPEIEIEE